MQVLNLCFQMLRSSKELTETDRRMLRCMKVSAETCRIGEFGCSICISLSRFNAALLPAQRLSEAEQCDLFVLVTSSKVVQCPDSSGEELLCFFG